MATSDTYTLNVDAKTTDAQAKVDALVRDLEGRTVEVPVDVAEPDTSAATGALDELATPVEVDSSVPAPDTTGFKSGMDDLDSRSDQSRSVLANLTGNAAQDLGELGGISGTTGVAIGQLAEYATDGNIAIGQLVKFAGPMLALTAAIEIGTRAWGAYTAKTNETKRVTKEVSDALADQGTALDDVTAKLDELVATDAASAFDKLNRALLEGLDEGEVVKVVGALGDLGMTVDDLAPSMAALEADTDDLKSGMQALAAEAGIPPEYVENIADAVHAGEDMGEVQAEIARNLMASGMANQEATAAAEDLTNKYHDQIAGLEQLNDAQQNADFDTIAEEQLKLARGADEATQALVAQAEAELGPDATALQVWSRYTELQNEAAAAAEGTAEAEKQAAEAAEQAAEAVEAYSLVLGGIDWRSAELEGATTAMDAYSTALHAGWTEASQSADAYRGLSSAIGDVGLQFETTTEAGQAQREAIQQLTGVIDTDLAQAYDDAGGDMQAFAANASKIRRDVIQKLTTDLGLSADEAGRVADAMGLTDRDIEARFELAGAEEARIKLGLLSGAIDAIPDEAKRLEIQMAIAAGDWSTALALTQTELEGQHLTAVADLEANAEPFIDEVDSILGDVREAPIYTVAPDAEETDAELDDVADAERTAEIDSEAPDAGSTAGELDDVAAASRTAEIDSTADTARAAQQLLDEASKFRVAYIYGYADATVARGILDDASETRTAHINAVANTSDAEAELNHAARTRTSYVNQYVRAYGRTAGSSSRAATDVAATAAPMATAAAPITINVPIHAAVIGDRYDVQRVVTRALRGAVRLAGSRT